MKSNSPVLWVFALSALILGGLIVDRVQAQQPVTYCNNVQSNSCNSTTCYTVSANCGLATPPSMSVYYAALISNVPYTACVTANNTGIQCSAINSSVMNVCYIYGYEDKNTITGDCEYPVCTGYLTAQACNNGGGGK